MNNVLTWFGGVLKSKIFWTKILFILIAATFWFLIKLSKNGYVTTIVYPVMYENIPESKMLIGNATNEISLRISSYGFRILGYEVKKVQPLRIDVKRHTRKSGNQKDLYYWLPNLFREELETQLDAQTALLRLEPDTVFLVLSEKIKKEVPIRLNVKTTFKPGYYGYAKATTTPEKIMISGPKIIVDSVEFIETVETNIDGISSNVSREIKLIINDDRVIASKETVAYMLEVDQFTEKVLDVPVRLTNVPKGYKATIMPSKIDVFCKVALRDINLLEANDVEVICDFAQLLEFPKRQHLQLEVNAPAGFFEVIKTSSTSVNFLLFKK
jgi:hypothetical protein